MQSTKKTLLSGVLYTAIARYSGILISLAVTAVLSRLLSPDDFGIVAIATVIISFFAIFTDMGISPAIIQNKELTDCDLSDLYSFTVWTGVIISILFFIASWPISLWYHSSILRILCQFLAIDLFFSSITIVPNALFYKNKEFKFIAWRSFIIQIASGTIGVIVALSGGGLYALIIGPILSSILIFLVSINKYPQRLKFELGLCGVKKIFSYSAYQFSFNVLYYFSRNLDKLLIGKYMSMSLLGYYEKSYRLMTLPLQNITHVITPVMHPVLSDFQQDIRKLSMSYEKIVRLLAFIGFPLSIILFFTAKELTLIIFGNQWLPSVPVFKILSLSVGLQIILSSSGSIFQAAGDTKSLFKCGLFSSVLNVSGMLIGIFFIGTLEGVAICICIAYCFNFIQTYWQMYFITFQKRFILIFMKELIHAVFLSLILGLILYITNILTESLNLFVSLTIKGILFIVISSCYIQLSGEYDIINRIKSLKKR